MTPNEFKIFIEELISDEIQTFLVGEEADIPPLLKKLKNKEIGVFAGIPSVMADDDDDKTDVKIPIIIYVLAQCRKLENQQVYDLMDDVFSLIKDILIRLKEVSKSCKHKVEKKKKIDPEMGFSESNGYSVQFNLTRHEL